MGWSFGGKGRRQQATAPVRQSNEVAVVYVLPADTRLEGGGFQMTCEVGADEVGAKLDSYAAAAHKVLGASIAGEGRGGSTLLIRTTQLNTGSEDVRRRISMEFRRALSR